MDASIVVRALRPCFTRTHNLEKNLLKGLLLCSGRNFASASQTQTNGLRRVFRTTEIDPRKHTLDHVGLYYRVSEQDMNSLFKSCIHPWHMRLVKTFNESCFMVRKPSLELNGYIRNLNLNHPVSRFVLYGRRGAGKKFVIYHTIHSCAKDNWIIVHAPWAGAWIRGWYKEVAESTHKPGRYDLPKDAAEWLTHFRSQNQGKLQDLKTTSEYVWTKREKAEAGTPFEEIINFGLTRLKFSSDCVGVILKELRQQAQTKGLKVLVAIFSVNAFYVPWNSLNTLKNSEKKRLHPSEISLIHNFKKMVSPTWSHGAVVCTVNETANNEELRKDFTPYCLLQQEGFEALDPFVPIFVPEYSEKEALSNIDYFIDRNWIQNEYGISEEAKKELIFVSNSNPFNLQRLCSSL